MKKIFYLFFLGILISSAVVAQCTPNSSLTATGFYPSTLPDAVAGVPYSQVVQFKIPSDTSLFTITAEVTSAKLNALTGLPSGFTSVCNIVNCTYNGGAVGCVTISGTAQNNQVAAYNVTASLTITGNIPGGPPYGGTHELPSSAPLAFNVVASNSILVNQVSAFSYTKKENEILFNNLSNGKLSVRIYDVLGSEVKNASYQILKGESTSISTANLESGIYIVTLQLNGKQETFKISKGFFN